MVVRGESTIDERGRGVDAGIDIPLGGIITRLTRLPLQKTNDKYAITVDSSRFLDTTGQPESLLNHSCDPSTYVDFRDWTLRAARALKIGDDLTFDYNTTEYTMEEPFHCVCGALNCHEYIAGFKNLPLAAQRGIFLRASPYLRQMFALTQLPSTEASLSGAVRDVRM